MIVGLKRLVRNCHCVSYMGSTPASFSVTSTTRVDKRMTEVVNVRLN